MNACCSRIRAPAITPQKNGVAICCNGQWETMKLFKTIKRKLTNSNKTETHPSFIEYREIEKCLGLPTHWCEEEETVWARWWPPVASPRWRWCPSVTNEHIWMNKHVRQRNEQIKNKNKSTKRGTQPMNHEKSQLSRGHTGHLTKPASTNTNKKNKTNANKKGKNEQLKYEANKH